MTGGSFWDGFLSLERQRYGRKFQLIAIPTPPNPEAKNGFNASMVASKNTRTAFRLSESLPRARDDG
jgi:hypothetical protein